MTKKEMKKRLKYLETNREMSTTLIKLLQEDNQSLEQELSYYKDFAADMIVRVREHS